MNGQRRSLKQLYSLLQSSSKFCKVPPYLLPCSVSSDSEARSSTSASFILTEGDLFDKPIFVWADKRLRYRAICCVINQSVLDNISGRCRLLNSIFGKPHCRRSIVPPLSSTRLEDNSLLSEKRRLLYVFSNTSGLR